MSTIIIPWTSQRKLDKVLLKLSHVYLYQSSGKKTEMTQNIRLLSKYQELRHYTAREEQPVAWLIGKHWRENTKEKITRRCNQKVVIDDSDLIKVRRVNKVVWKIKKEKKFGIQFLLLLFNSWALKCVSKENKVSNRSCCKLESNILVLRDEKLKTVFASPKQTNQEKM